MTHTINKEKLEIYIKCIKPGTTERQVLDIILSCLESEEECEHGVDRNKILCADCYDVPTPKPSKVACWGCGAVCTCPPPIPLQKELNKIANKPSKLDEIRERANGLPKYYNDMGEKDILYLLSLINREEQISRFLRKNRNDYKKSSDKYRKALEKIIVESGSLKASIIAKQALGDE